MGWSSGTDVMSNIISAVKETIADEDTRYELYKGIVSALENADWDCMDECFGEDPAYDRLAIEEEWVVFDEDE